MGRKRSTVVKSTPDEVFNYLADVTRHGDGAGHLDFTVFPTFGEGLVIGATFERAGSGKGAIDHWFDPDTAPQSIEIKIVEFSPFERLGFDCQERRRIWKVHLLRPAGT